MKIGQIYIQAYKFIQFSYKYFFKVCDENNGT